MVEDFDPLSLQCCGRTFGSKAALGIHRSRAHCEGYLQYKEWLRHTYYDDGLTMAAIANHLGITGDAVEIQMKRFGFVKRNKKVPWNRGLRGAQRAWNKGLNRTDARVNKYTETRQSNWRRLNKLDADINKAIRHLVEYKKWRASVFARDGFKSVMSGKNGYLHAHHKVSLAQIIDKAYCSVHGNMPTNMDSLITILKDIPAAWDVENGVTLLKDEHTMIHTKKIQEKLAIVTGAAGQDGSYLSEHLIKCGYRVIGVDRKKSTLSAAPENLWAVIDNANFTLENVDITDPAAVNWLVQRHHPEMYFNLAAQSHVGHSFDEPLLTMRTNAEAVLILLDAIRRHSPNTKVYQAGTSELWGGFNCPPDGFDESSNFNPRSPYAVAKAAAYHAIKNYREAYGIYAVNGILCNHSSVRRPPTFATRKITSGIADIVTGRASKIKMGNLEAFRDEGAAPDYVRAMLLMLQQNEPDDYVVATGSGATIREMLEYVCSLANLDIDNVYEADERFMRPSDVPYLKGNSAKIRALGWLPEYTWRDLLKEMYEHDLGLASL